MGEILDPKGTRRQLESSCDHRLEYEFPESMQETGGVFAADVGVVMVALATAVVDEDGDADKTFQWQDDDDGNLLDERQDLEKPC